MNRPMYVPTCPGISYHSRIIYVEPWFDGPWRYLGPAMGLILHRWRYLGHMPPDKHTYSHVLSRTLTYSHCNDVNDLTDVTDVNE